MMKILVIVVALVLLASMAQAQVWNLAADFSATTNGANGWTYGYYDGAAFTTYAVPDVAGMQGSTFNGWHNNVSWDNCGSLGKNMGPGAMHGFGFYAAAGDVRSQGSDTSVLPGALWTCPGSGQYLVNAAFIGDWATANGQHPTEANPTYAKVVKGTTVLGEGTIYGFAGVDYTDATGTPYSLPAFGANYDYKYSGILDLAQGDSLIFAAGGAGSGGHTAILDITVTAVPEP